MRHRQLGFGLADEPPGEGPAGEPMDRFQRLIPLCLTKRVPHPGPWERPPLLREELPPRFCEGEPLPACWSRGVTSRLASWQASARLSWRSLHKQQSRHALGSFSPPPWLPPTMRMRLSMVFTVVVPQTHRRPGGTRTVRLQAAMTTTTRTAAAVSAVAITARRPGLPEATSTVIGAAASLSGGVPPRARAPGPGLRIPFTSGAARVAGGSSPSGTSSPTPPRWLP